MKFSTEKGRKISEKLKGKKKSPEHIKNMSIAMKGRKSPGSGIYTRTEEHKNKISIGLKKANRKLSPENKKKLIEANIKRLLGSKQSEELKIKRGIYKKGSEATRWEGGISFDIEHRKKSKREWIIKNRDYVNYTNSIARAKRLCVEGDYSFKDWEEIKKLQNYICNLCGKKEPEIKLTIDHIIPLSKNGNNKKENIQGLCLHCNCVKHNKLIDAVKLKLE